MADVIDAPDRLSVAIRIPEPCQPPAGAKIIGYTAYDPAGPLTFFQVSRLGAESALKKATFAFLANGTTSTLVAHAERADGYQYVCNYGIGSQSWGEWRRD